VRPDFSGKSFFLHAEHYMPHAYRRAFDARPRAHIRMDSAGMLSAFVTF
jgi:hypothetical protein